MDALNTENFYRIRSIGNDGDIKYSSIVKTGTVQLTASIAIYPNPVTGRIIHLYTSGMAAGKYNFKIIHMNGQVTDQSCIIISDRTMVKEIPVKESMIPGKYILIITSEAGENFTESILIR